MVKGVSVTLYDSVGATYSSGTDIAVMWFDSYLPPELGMIKGQSAIATTTVGGVLSLDLDAVTGLSVGEYGFLVCYRLDETDHRDSPIFASKMEVVSMTGTTTLRPLTSYTRNSDWPTSVPPTSGTQKFTGMLAVFDTPYNYVALSAAANYTINWGDGSGDINISTGVTAERNIAYADVPGTIVGASDAVSVTFTDTGDIVSRTAHGFQNGQRINFASIVSTTGIIINTTYYVVNKAANTFQVSATLGGSALILTTNGSGTVYIPKYKVAVITVTPQAANNLTELSLQKVHSDIVDKDYPTTAWIDVAINSTFLTSLEISSGLLVTYLAILECVALGENALTNLTSLLEGLRSLRYISELNTASCTSFYSIFSGCYSLQAIPFLDTSAGTLFSGMFSACINIQVVPLLDTSSGTDFQAMLIGCAGLQSIPEFDTSSATTLNSMMYNCSGIKTAPILDTSACTDFSYMFQGCTRLETIPNYDMSSGTTFCSMFRDCSALLSIGSPYLNTSAGLDFSAMFYGCSALTEGPQIDTHLGTTFSEMFGACLSLVNIPMLDTSAGTDFSYMFQYDKNLRSIPKLNVSSGAYFTSMFEECSSLSIAALEGTSQNINYSGALLSAAELDAIYTALATVTSKTIYVSGNPGIVGDTPSIATTKGWTVTSA